MTESQAKQQPPNPPVIDDASNHKYKTTKVVSQPVPLASTVLPGTSTGDNSLPVAASNPTGSIEDHYSTQQYTGSSRASALKPSLEFLINGPYQVSSQQFYPHSDQHAFQVPQAQRRDLPEYPLLQAKLTAFSQPQSPKPVRIFELGHGDQEQDSLNINDSEIDQDDFINNPTDAASLSGTLDSQQISPTLSSCSLQPAGQGPASQPGASNLIPSGPQPPVVPVRPKKRVVFLRSPDMPPREPGNGNSPGAGAQLPGSRRTSTEANQTVLLCDHDDGEKAALHPGANHPRQRQPRVSLHGKPISLRHHRRDARYRKVQAKIYNFLERPRGCRAVAYHMLVFFLVFGCFCVTVVSTVPEFESSTQQPLFWMELIIVVWFTVEFLLRMWSVGCRSRYQGVQGRVLFFKRPFTIIDTIVIVASIVVLGIGSHGQVFAASALRGLRFFQILRMVRMDRRGGTWKLLGSVVWAHRQELLTTFYIGFLGLIFASFLIYLVEKDANPRLDTFADALWWGVITLATVGYGDTVPTSWKGKLIAGICAMMGISFFALPASILGSGFALKVQQQQRQKHLIRRRNPAALLIQCMWRCYAADERSRSVATWEPHLKSIRQAATGVIPTPSKFHPSSTSFVSRFSTIKRPKHPTVNHVGSSGNVGSPPAHSGKHSALSATPSSRSIHNKSSSAADLLRRDNSAARKTLSAPLDAHSSNKEPGSNPTLHHRRMALTRTEDLRKADQDDEETTSVDIPIPTQLTDAQRRVIRAIRKMKYFVAKRKFREALKPYDVKDVIEQYSAGHVDLLARVKNLQARCDQILGKQNSKSLDVYDSKVSLASRVVKIERQVDDIEGKIDTLLDLFLQQRNSSNSAETSPGLQGPSGELLRCKTPTTKTGKLRPILLNHQTSDPVFVGIPTHESLAVPDGSKQRPILRGYSDLGLIKTVDEVPPVHAPILQKPYPPPIYDDLLLPLEPMTKASSLLMPTGMQDISASSKPCDNVATPSMLSCTEEDEPAFIDDEPSSGGPQNAQSVQLRLEAPLP